MTATQIETRDCSTAWLRETLDMVALLLADPTITAPETRAMLQTDHDAYIAELGARARQQAGMRAAHYS